MLLAWITVVALALAVASAAMTLTKAKVFAAPRAWIRAHSTFLGELFSCPYCMSHWLAFIAVLVFQPVLVACPLPYIGKAAEVLLATFVVVTFNTAFVWVIFHAYADMPAPEDDTH